MKLTPQIGNLISAADALGPIVERLVFVGGGVVDVLITDPKAAEARFTKDIDVIVELTTTIDYYALGDQLRQRGFREDHESHVICRWIGGGLILDVMPTKTEILGFGNPWYESAFKNAQATKLPGGRSILVIDSCHFLATKFEAFHSRGEGDLFLSHDLEDIIAVVNGRPELTTEIQRVEPVLKHSIAANVNLLLGEADFETAAEGHLASIRDSKLRTELVLERLRALAANK